MKHHEGCGMQNQTHILDMLPAYALGALDEAEAQLVSRHLAGCTLCQTELSGYQDVVGQLGLAVAERAPSPTLRQRLLHGVQALRPGSAAPRGKVRLGRWQPLRLVWGAASFMLMFALGAASLLLWQQA